MDIHLSNSNPEDVACDVLAVGAGNDWATELADLDARLDGHLLPWLEKRSFTGKAGAIVAFPTLGRLAARELVVVGTGDRKHKDLATAAGKAAREARTSGSGHLALALGHGADDLAAVAEAAQAGAYEYDAHKPEDDRTAPVETLTVLGVGDSASLDQVGPRARRQSWARDLVNMPAAELYPETLAAHAQELAAIPGVTVEVWDYDRLHAESCVGIIAVGQGSTKKPCMIRVHYAPDNARAHVALVGKGVTFDSGGLSLKPSPYMQTMRCDMGGSATVLGAIAAAAEMKLPVKIDCFVGAAENMNGPESYKLGDVLKYNNGVTVEIHNTDAEGRLVLADCLIEACKTGAEYLVDAATLTGAAAIAVGPDFAALFTDDDDFAAALHAAANANAEGLWRLPLHAPYKSMLKGEWGQIKNVGGRDAGATTAALFLQHFVDGPRWAHLDIAGSAFHEKAHGIYAAGATGEMVRTLVSWLETL